jgi:hypothetical protein
MGMSIKITDDLLGIEEYDIARKVGSKLTKNNDDLSHTVKPMKHKLLDGRTLKCPCPAVFQPLT